MTAAPPDSKPPDSKPTARKSRARKVRTIPYDRMAVLYAVMLVAAAGNTATQSILPAIGTKLAIPDVWVSLAFSWSAFLWMVTAPHWARLSDKRGRRQLMALGVAGFIVSMTLGGIVLWSGLNGWLGAGATFLAFACFRSFYGGLGSAAPPAVQAYVASRTRAAERTQAIALISSSFGLGTVLGPAIAPFLIFPMLGIGLAGPLFAFAALAIIVLVALRWRLPNDKPSFAVGGSVAAYPIPIAATADETWESTRRKKPAPKTIRETQDNDTAPLAWRDKRSAPWLFAGFLGGQPQAMILGVVGFLILDRLALRETPDLAAAPIGLVLMSGAIASLLAQWGLIPLLKPAPRTAVISGAILASLGLIGTGLAADLHGIVLGFAIASLGFGLIRPGFTAGASLAVPPQHQGAVAGMTASINGSAFIISPALGVLIYGQAPAAAFALMTFFCLLLIIWAWRGIDRNPAI